jgi:hypothetical protein
MDGLTYHFITISYKTTILFLDVVEKVEASQPYRQLYIIHYLTTQWMA